MPRSIPCPVTSRKDSRYDSITGGFVDTREGAPGRSGAASNDRIDIIDSPSRIAQRRAAAAAPAEPPKPKRKWLGVFDDSHGTQPKERIACLVVPDTAAAPAPTKPDPYASAAESDPRDKWISGGYSPAPAYSEESKPTKPAPLAFGSDPRDKWISGPGPVTAENLYQTFPEPDPEYVEKVTRLYAGIPTKNGERIGALYPKFLNECLPHEPRNRV